MSIITVLGALATCVACGYHFGGGWGVAFVISAVVCLVDLTDGKPRWRAK